MLIGLGAGLLFIPLFLLVTSVASAASGRRFRMSVWLLLFLAVFVFLGTWVLLNGLGIGG